MISSNVTLTKCPIFCFVIDSVQLFLALYSIALGPYDYLFSYTYSQEIFKKIVNKED